MNVKSIVFVALAIAVVAALWLFFKPQREELPVADSAKAAAPASASAMGAAAGAPAPPTPARHDETFELQIKGGRPVGGPVLLQVHEGEQVTLNIKSDGTDELHLHGYDLHAHITPDKITTLQFNAGYTGHFGLELHKAHTELGALEVYPQ